VTTDQGRYVLTLFEKLTRAELPFYLALMGHLAGHEVPCPRPIRNARDEALGELNGKPAALMTCLPGAAVMQPEAGHCAAVGAVLGRMHLAARSFGEAPDNPRGPAWRAATAPQVMPFLDESRQRLLEAELHFQSRLDRRSLPCGPVHADLFRDNVLFDGAAVGGVIDFYFAGVDAFLFDVAVTLNDWCIDHPTGTVIDAKADAFLRAYASERPFTDAERTAWPGLLRAAALRFWLSRLYDFYLPRAGELIRAHDPEHFHRVLARRVADAARPPRLP
jgi:homoserine kinase type II